MIALPKWLHLPAKNTLLMPAYLRSGLLLAAGLSVSVLAFAAAWNWENEQFQGQLQKRSEKLAQLLQHQIDLNVAAIENVSDFYSASSDDLTRAEFNLFAGNQIARLSSLQSLFWTPRVPHAQRRIFESLIQKQGFANFGIVEQPIFGTMAPAVQRSEYFPILYLVPREQQEFALGFDVASQGQNKIILEQARDTGAIAASGLVQLLNGSVGILIAAPIYAPNMPANTLAARRQNLKGFALGTMTINDLLKNAFAGVNLPPTDVAIYEENRQHPKKLLAYYEWRSRSVITTLTSSDRLEKWGVLPCTDFTDCTSSIYLHNRQWSLELIFTTNDGIIRNHPLAWGVLLIGLMLNGFLLFYLIRLQRHTLHIEHLIAQLSEANFEIRSLSRLSNSLQACLTVEEAYEVIPRLIQKLFPEQSGAIYTIGASGNLVESCATWGKQLSSKTIFSPDDCWGIRCGRSHLYENTNSGLVCQHVQQPFPAKSLCVPMMAQGEALGLLYLSSGNGEKFPPGKVQLAETVAEHIALGLANLKLRETLKNQSIRDSLTGLFNRRYMEESLQRELHRAERSGHSLGIIMLDIDHFKQFNDTFGHEAGDTLLQELGQFLRGNIRGSDIACRYGGEEFALILPEASLEATCHRAEHLRAGVKHLQVQYLRQSLGRITLSLGVAIYPEHGLSVLTLLRAADAALYQAKAQGRDRVVSP